MNVIGAAAWLSGAQWRLYAALAVLVAVVGGSAYCGWTVRSWKAADELVSVKATLQRERNEAVAAREARIAATNAALDEQREVGRTASVVYEKKVRQISEVSQRLRGELRNAQEAAANRGVPACHLDPEWVRLYDASLRSGSNQGAPTGGSAGASQGAGLAPPR